MWTKLSNIIIVCFTAIQISMAGLAAETDETIKAYAAGYKAAFTCSAVFNAGKSVNQLGEEEFYGIYPLITEAFNALPDAEVDRESKLVKVAYLPGMPPRISVWRPHLGCVQLPVGASVEAALLMPAIEGLVGVEHAHEDNGDPWLHFAPINGSTGNTRLDEVVRGAFSDPVYGRDARTSAILIATPDTILAEHYIKGYTNTTSQRTWSVAKSIAVSVIGAAVEQQLIKTDEAAGLAAWSLAADPRKIITIENLLHMASGLDSNRAGNRTDRLYMGGGTVGDTALRGALEVLPGSRWKYANNDTLLAMRALRERLADTQAYLKFPYESLLYRIGMTHTKLETDWNGNFILSSQVWTTSRDLARLGVLHLKDGLWKGERILPKGWTEYVSRPAPVQPALSGPRGTIPGYGAQWWLYNERFSDIPDDAFAARGNRGQFVMIIPSHSLVIVRRGYDPAGGEGFKLHTFTQAVLAAMNQHKD